MQDAGIPYSHGLCEDSACVRNKCENKLIDTDDSKGVKVVATAEHCKVQTVILCATTAAKANSPRMKHKTHVNY